MAWKHGHTDYQVPRSSGTQSLNYILKYITKSVTTKTVWKKIFLAQSAQSVISPTSKLKEDLATGVFAETLLPAVTKTTSLNITKSATHHLSGVKFCTWSRSFNFLLFLPNSTREPCLKTPPIHKQSHL